MTPVLLDQKSILKTGISIILVMAVVFVSGYYVGYQKAESGKGVDLNKTMVLALPKPAHADVAEFEPFVPQLQLRGADIDVDSPELVADAIDIEHHADAQVSQAETQIAAVIDQTTNAIEKPVSVDNQHGHNRQQLQLASLTTVIDERNTLDQALVISDTNNNQQRVDSVESQRAAVISNTASAEDARYTIQVGVFSDAENAMRRKTELESRQLTAYINTYKNKRDQPRFNVRFGYFKDKSSAVAALTRFEQDMSGSGYVTRLRRN
jgi:cell division septation protein DedD